MVTILYKSMALTRLDLEPGPITMAKPQAFRICLVRIELQNLEEELQKQAHPTHPIWSMNVYDIFLLMCAAVFVFFIHRVQSTSEVLK